MDFYWSIVYGFIQGVTEFLPISSSGHLALIPYFFKLEDPGVLFDLLMHLGTAFAVILYFRKEVYSLILELKKLIIDRDVENTSFIQNFIISTFGSFLLILLIKDFAFDYGRSAKIIGFNFILFGILMFIADKKKNLGVDLTKKRNLKMSLLIGLSQSLAVFPGVSRSGATLSSSRFLGMGRVEASRFSFLLSLPVILGSIVFKVPEILGGSIPHVEVSVMVSGIIFSFLFGIITIHVFLKLIAKIGLVYFSIYRVLIGVLLIFLS